MSSYRNGRALDAKIADDVGREMALQCTANGCPNRWSVDFGNGRLCGAHDAAPAHYWPAVTQQQNDLQIDLAIANAAKVGHEPARYMRREDRVALVERLRNLMQPRDRGMSPAAYAVQRILGLERDGLRLTPAQADMLRTFERKSGGQS